jgi:hypothetical protein
MGTLYGSSWQASISRFDTAIGHSLHISGTHIPTSPSKITREEEIRTLFEGNYFSNIQVGGFTLKQLAVPVGINLRITPPVNEPVLTDWPEVLFGGQILLNSKFFTIKIVTEKSFLVGSSGEYQALAGLSDEQAEQIFTANYTVRFTAQFSPWFSGHPEMAKYKTWARQFADELRKQFDEELIWRKTKEDYLFSKQSALLGPVKDEP